MAVSFLHLMPFTIILLLAFIFSAYHFYGYLEKRDFGHKRLIFGIYEFICLIVATGCLYAIAYAMHSYL